jgi:hypothetical protein
MYGIIDIDDDGNIVLPDGSFIPEHPQRPILMSEHEYAVQYILDIYRTAYWVVIKYVAPLL